MGGFFDEFLCVVLAKATVTRVVDLADERDRFSFRNGHDPDQVGFPTRPLRSLPDSEHDRPERRHRCAFHRRSSHVVSFREVEIECTRILRSSVSEKERLCGVGELRT